MPQAKGKAAQKTKKKVTAQQTEKKSPQKAKEIQEQEKRTKHVEGIKKTLLSSLLGIVAGIVILSACVRHFNSSRRRLRTKARSASR